MNKQLCALVAASILAVSATGEVQEDDPSMTVATTIQNNLGVFVYPEGEQDSAAQAKDEVVHETYCGT